jgi:predicted GIY-YIG superfamily endonuclease
MVTLYLIMVGLIFGFAMGLYVGDTPNRRDRKWEKRQKQRSEYYTKRNEEKLKEFKEKFDVNSPALKEAVEKFNKELNN